MKGLDIITDFDKLQLLSNRHAFRILKELQKESFSGAQLAEKLGMTAPHVIYYLKKLEKSDLIKQIARKPVRGNREKFYCAAAHEFLISAGLDEIDEFKSGINASLNHSYIEYFMKRDLDLDLDEFARVVTSDYLSIQPGDKVVIAFEEKNIGIYIKIVTQLHRIGVQYRTIVNDNILAREMLMNLPEREIKIYYNGIASMVEWADAWIELKRSTVRDTKGIPKKRLDFITEERRRALKGINEKSDTRAIIISIPRFEERFHTDQHVLEKLTTFWKAASLNGDGFRDLSDLAGRMRDLDHFSIHTGQNNVLHARVDRNKYFIDAGPFSSSSVNNIFFIPSGEISFVPYLSDLSGNIYMDYCELDYTEAKGIHLEVENGIVTDCKVENGDNRLEEYFKTSDTKGRTISQVGFGLNTAARSKTNIPRLDTKIFGSFHLSFGSNLAVGGDISGYTTWDIIAEKPKITRDEKIILNNGKYYI